MAKKKKQSKNKRIKFLLNLIPSYSYRMCYNNSGEVFNPDGSTYELFDNKKGLIKILAKIINN